MNGHGEHGEFFSFNLQAFLVEMRKEQKEDLEEVKADIQSVYTEVKAALAEQGLHATRITLLERFRGNSVKAGWLLFGAVIVFLFDLIADHGPAIAANLKP